MGGPWDKAPGIYFFFLSHVGSGAGGEVGVGEGQGGRGNSQVMGSELPRGWKTQRLKDTNQQMHHDTVTCRTSEPLLREPIQ